MSSPLINPKSCLKVQVAQGRTKTSTDNHLMGHPLMASSIIHYEHSQTDSTEEVEATSETVKNTRYNTPYYHISSKDRISFVNLTPEQSGYIMGDGEVEAPGIEDNIDPLLRDLEQTNAAANSLRYRDDLSDLGFDDDEEQEAAMANPKEGQERAEEGQPTGRQNRRSITWNEAVEVRLYRKHRRCPALSAKYRLAGQN